MDQNTTENKRTGQRALWIKILVPALIAVVICGMFLLKNMQKKQDGDHTGQSTQSNPYPLNLTSANLVEIKTYGVPTVIDFGSDTCIPCKNMAPVLETLNAEWQGRAAVQFIDVWKYSDGVRDFPIQVIPTQVFFTAEGTPFVPSPGLAEEIDFDYFRDAETGAHTFTIHQGGLTEEEMRMIFAEMGVA